MRSTSWCVPSPTMERTCSNRCNLREWEHTRVSSTMWNGMNCKRLLPFLFLSSLLQLLKVVINFDTPSFYFFFFKSPIQQQPESSVCRVLTLDWLCPPLSQHQLPHRGSCAPTGVHTEPDFVRGAEPKCRWIPRLQQTEEGAGAAGQSFHPPLWLQTVSREE